jgi:hypothetical protein
VAGFTKTVLTNKGRNLYAKAQTGTPISFPKVKIGSGQLAGGQTLETLTDLIAPVMTNIPIQSISYLGDGKTRIRIQITNTGLVTGFYFREIGLYATDPQEGEILYCVSNAGSQADFIPSEGSVAFEQVIDIITQIGNANTTAIIQDTGAHVLIQDFSDHRTAAVIDHPDGSVIDAKIGNRTVTDSTALSGSAASLTTILGRFGNMLKQITGEANWFTVPSISLKTIFGKFNASTGHKHTGAADDGPQLTSTGLADGAATDGKIGNRTANQNDTITSTLTGTVTQLFSFLYTRVKQIMGTTNFYDAVPITLADIFAKFSTSGHTHDGNTGNGPKVAYSNLTGAPSTMTPTAHAVNTTTYGIGTASVYGHAMASSATPLVAGTASVGTDNGKYAREGHVHPAQTSVSGNAGTATKLATARTISMTGDVSWTVSFDGSGNATAAATVADDSHNHVIGNVDGLQEALNTITGSRVWMSGEYAPVQNTPTIVSHGISGLDPEKASAEVRLKCAVANNGYAVGDYAIAWSILTSSADQLPPIPLLTSSTIQINTGSAASPPRFRGVSKSDGVAVQMLLADWRYVFRIFY